MITASISLLSMTLRQSLYKLGTFLPVAFSTSAARLFSHSSSMSQRATHSTSGYFRKLLRLEKPIERHPIRATFTLLLGAVCP